ncbi:MAG: DUF58 domain-containing protein [Ardenticatenales bacterium]|nr:DUF58 domain-containing protein [Ardenticatenales bacterium]
MLTARGYILLLVAAPLLAAATWVPFLEWLALAYLLACLLLFYLDWRWAEGVGRFAVSRELDSKLSLGAENQIELTVRNRGRRPTPLQLRDEPPDAFISDKLLHEGELPGLGSWRGNYQVRPLRRGDYSFANVTLRWQGPFGLVRRQGQVDLTTPVKVYPNLLDVRRYDLLLRQNRVQELGLRNTRLLGEGTEFERLREYLPDDDFRRINWKATARRNRPVTMEYQSERSQNIVAVLDTGRMMQSPIANMAKLDYVINAVLLLGYVATGLGDKVGLMTFADEVGSFLTPRQGRGQFYRMLEYLYAIEPQPVEPNYNRALSYLAQRQRKRALMIIFTDISGGSGIEQLVSNMSVIARRSLPLVVTIADPDIVAASQLRPRDSLAVYQQAAAAALLDQRRVALDTLRYRGVDTLDVPANQLSISVINRYLSLKAKEKI